MSSRPRLSAVEALRHGSPILVCDVDAAAQRTVAATSASLSNGQGGRLALADFVRSLDAAGYERQRIVVEPASFAVRGGIIDFWPPADQSPVRIELFGDEVESIRRFDPWTQRSTEAVEVIGLRPGPRVESGSELGGSHRGAVAVC